MSPQDDYRVHPLQALDGVLLYVTLRGEHVGSFFGTTELAAASAAVMHLTEAEQSA